MRWIPLIAMLACKPKLAPPAPSDTDMTDTDTDAPPTVLPTPSTPPRLTAPDATGPQAVHMRVEELDVGQELPVRLRVFEPAQADTRVALILTGFSLAPDLYDSYAQHLASHGYVAIGVGLRTNAFNVRTQISLAADVSAVIDWVGAQNGGAFANLDTSRTVIAGHSLGGKLALLTALEDTRVHGVAGIDPVDSNPPGVEASPENPSLAPERIGEISFPLLLIGEDQDQALCAPSAENYRVLFEHASAPVVRVEIEGANHMSFLDNPDCGFLCNICVERQDDPAVTRNITKGLLYAYFEHVLLERDGAREYLITVPEHSAAGLVNLNVKNGF